MKKPLTLVFIVKDGQVLLGMKKRGFGAGWWNGFGGKLQDGEAVEEAARRELLEEAGVTAHTLRERGRLEFSFDGSEDILDVHIYECTEYSGVPMESEEMKPQWFDFDQVPYQSMWADDRFWLPQFLAGERISGKFHFDADKQVKSYKLN